MVGIPLELDLELGTEGFQLGFIAIELLRIRMIWRRPSVYGGRSRSNEVGLNMAELLGELVDSFLVEGMASDGLVYGIVRISS